MNLEQVRNGTTSTTTRDDLLRAAPFGARPLVKALSRLRKGQLTVVLPRGERQVITADQAGPVATLYLRRPLALTLRLAARGALGLAEGFIAGDWRSLDPTSVLRVLALNESCFGEMAAGRRFARSLDRIQHRLRANNLRGSRRNIAFHYDLGNDFYRLWLDTSMSYSAALFEGADEDLESAQKRKYARILDRLDARPGARILEIGCGWGGFAEYAAERGFRVTGITLSHEQLAHARRRIRTAGLSDRVELRLQDYREIDGRFDHVVSIEMFEAVGEAYWPTYFDTVRRVLRPGGRASLQVITIEHERFRSYRENTDFIQKYIFPGGMLPSPRVFAAGAQAAGLDTREQAFYGHDYARTLRCWDERVLATSHDIEAMGFDERFLRMWRYYLAYCEAGFLTGRIDLMQTVLERPA